MTVWGTVRAALTEERSKTEIKNSALRRRDETKSFCTALPCCCKTHHSGGVLYSL
ncbi:MAG: hypothetical protein J6L85_01615 [Clostridia bacterium]|nr:hypothetical protein [Clostridia bacterium]